MPARTLVVVALRQLDEPAHFPTNAGDADADEQALDEGDFQPGRRRGEDAAGDGRREADERHTNQSHQQGQGKAGRVVKWSLAHALSLEVSKSAHASKLRKAGSDTLNTLPGFFKTGRRHHRMLATGTWYPRREISKGRFCRAFRKLQEQLRETLWQLPLRLVSFTELRRSTLLAPTNSLHECARESW